MVDVAHLVPPSSDAADLALEVQWSFLQKCLSKIAKSQDRSMAFNWDDLRIFIAAARAGSATGAAERLGLDATTVGRRIAALETAIKATLFVRARTGLQLTAAGARLMQTALIAESTMNDVADVAQHDLIAGVIRVSASEGFGSQILAPALVDLKRSHPGLNLELIANPGFLSPLNREVDMAITLSPPKSDRLLVEPLTEYELGLYASCEYLSGLGRPKDTDDLKRHQMVGYVQDQVYAPELLYLEEINAALRPALASSSIRAQLQIISAGGGIGVLPCFMAAGLERVLAGQVRLMRRFWMATHRDVATTARVRAVRDWLKRLVAAQRGLLSPGGPSRASTRAI
jgi:DNA-binding transcriptional LysR family regulator